MGPAAPARGNAGRRALLAVGAAVLVGLLVAGGVAIRRPPVNTRGARVMRDTVASPLLGRDLEQIVVLPRGFREADGRGLLVLLHGRGDSPAGRLNDPLLEAVAAAGDDAPVVLLANGGESSYYHDRTDGPWGSYLTDELIPSTIARFGLDRQRVAYAGISMGGFGALELVRQSGHRQCGVAGIAPALWHTAAQTPTGAFDDAEDFRRHDLLGAVGSDPDALHQTPVYLVVGDQDPFAAATADFAAALDAGGAPVVHKTPDGGHDAAFWDGQMEAVVTWAAGRLRDC